MGGSTRGAPFCKKGSSFVFISSLSRKESRVGRGEKNGNNRLDRRGEP
jgi:hypothetical protein